MMISVEDMAEYGEFIAAVAPTAPVITVPRLTTVAMAEETLEKSCIVPAAAAAAAAVLHGDGSGRATYNPRRNVRNLGHVTGRPDDVSVGATKPPALEEAAEEEEEEEEDLLGNLWTEMQEQCWLAGPTTLMLMLQYLTGLIVISFVGLLGAQYLAAHQLDQLLCGYHWFRCSARTSKWTRDFVWTSLWSKAVPSGGNLLAAKTSPESICSDLKLRFSLLIWLFKWQLGAMDISDSDSAGWTATEHRNRDGSIYHWFVAVYAHQNDINGSERGHQVNIDHSLYQHPSSRHGPLCESVRAANELGADQPHRARFAVVASTAMVMFMGIIMAAMVLLLQNVWGRAFSQEQEVLDRVSGLHHILQFLQF
ncbi:unnamed protein product [Sphagnum balticum]